MFLTDWREISKTSRINIWDLRFEELLNRILSEKEKINPNRALEGNGETTVDCSQCLKGILLSF